MQLFLVKVKFVDDEFLQLAYTKMVAEALGLEFAKYLESITEEMDSVLLMTRVGSDYSTSRSAKHISKLLTEMGFDHECQVYPDSSISGGMLAINFACKEQMVAIEYDGERCFLKVLRTGELTTTRNGKTKAKRRLLEQLGWTVINLDYRDYMEACRKSNHKQWLQTELKRAGVALPYI